MSRKRRTISTTARRWLPVAAIILWLVVPASPSWAQGTITHVVQPGDTLAQVAQRYGTTVWAIAEANGLRSIDRIVTGQRLRIPGSTSGSSGEGIVHVVQWGDTLAKIARRYGTTVSAIIQANGLQDMDRIVTGQRLRIPGSTSGSSSEGTIHVVQWGETLAKIARRYGTSVRALMRANGLSDADRIITGQRLVIPGAGHVPDQPTVAIWPTSGPAGTLVQVVASGFPAYSAASVGVGPLNSEFSEVATGTTDANGRFTTQVTVRGLAGMEWVFGVEAGGVHAMYYTFHVTGS